MVRWALGPPLWADISCGGSSGVPRASPRAVQVGTWKKAGTLLPSLTLSRPCGVTVIEGEDFRLHFNGSIL